MTWYSRTVIAAAVALAAPAAFAQTSLILPPYDGGTPPAIATQGQALAALSHRGVADVRCLALVGDYWEGAGMLGGKPVVAYVFDNGALEIHPASPGALMQAFGTLPQPSGAS